MPRPTNGTAVQQWGTNSNTAQKFAILASGTNWKIAMTINTNKCIGPAYNGTGNSTAIEVQDCNGGNAQAWTATLVSGTTDTFNFKNVAANRCLDVQGYSTADGARMQLYDCGGGNNQKFAVRPTSPPAPSQLPCSAGPSTAGRPFSFFDLRPRIRISGAGVAFVATHDPDAGRRAL